MRSFLLAAAVAAGLASVAVADPTITWKKTVLDLKFRSEGVAIADVPLLFETGHQHDFDRVIVCACEPAEQIRRVMARDGLTRGEAQARLDAQWPIHEKAARADYVIRTDGTFAATDEEIKRVFDALDAAA